MPKSIVLLFCFYCCLLSCSSETKKKKSAVDRMVLAYTEKYAKLAQTEMKNSGVPASIKLAQGILESKYGQSELAKKANNHFGIKCSRSWDGLRYSVLSDEWDKKRKKMVPRLGCFRVYKNVAECYRAHSEFLKQERYVELFSLGSTDYKNWALGLQKLGYATDPEYAKKLIRLIERYKLNNYDTTAG